MAIKIIPDGDADLEASLAALEAMWEAGATSVTIERPAPAIVDLSAIAGISVISPDCDNCKSPICPSSCREAHHACRVYQLQQEYSEQERALERAGENLRREVSRARG